MILARILLFLVWQTDIGLKLIGISKYRVLILGIKSTRFNSDLAYKFKIYFRLFPRIKEPQVMRLMPCPATRSWVGKIRGC